MVSVGGVVKKSEFEVIIPVLIRPVCGSCAESIGSGAYIRLVIQGRTEQEAMMKLRWYLDKAIRSAALTGCWSRSDRQKER